MGLALNFEKLNFREYQDQVNEIVGNSQYSVIKCDDLKQALCDELSEKTPFVLEKNKRFPHVDTLNKALLLSNCDYSYLSRHYRKNGKWYTDWVRVEADKIER